jgi:hypothetical protein
MMPIKLLEKQEQTNPQPSRWREIIKIRAEINELETKKIYKRINEKNCCLFEKISEIDKPLAKMTKQEGKDTN